MDSIQLKDLSLASKAAIARAVADAMRKQVLKMLESDRCVIPGDRIMFSYPLDFLLVEDKDFCFVDRDSNKMISLKFQSQG